MNPIPGTDTSVNRGQSSLVTPEPMIEGAGTRQSNAPQSRNWLLWALLGAIALVAVAVVIDRSNGRANVDGPVDRATPNAPRDTVPPTPGRP